MLDEPTNGIDKNYKDDIQKILNEMIDTKRIIIIATHLFSDFSRVKKEIYSIQGKQIVKSDILLKKYLKIVVTSDSAKEVKEFIKQSNSTGQVKALSDNQMQLVLDWIPGVEKINSKISEIIEYGFDICSIEQLREEYHEKY